MIIQFAFDSNLEAYPVLHLLADFNQRPSLSELAQPQANLPPFVRHCPVAQKYLALLSPLDWVHFPERDPHHPWPGPLPHPRPAYVAAFLVKLNEGKSYMSHLRDYLLEHPALVWLLGFRLTASPDFPWGFDPEASLPTARHFGRVLRTLPNEALQFLLDSTVQLIGQELPPEVSFGQTIAGDTKHILAFVAENNPKAYIKESERLDKTRQPAGDPTCKLGCKKKYNQKKKQQQAQAQPTVTPQPQAEASPPAAKKRATQFSADQYFWGYGSGVISTKVPDWGEVVLAELTQPFNKPELSYFFPLMEAVERRLGFKPPYGAFDAGFEAFYVFDYFDQAGGFAAIPFSQRGGIKRQFDEQGLPLCQAGLSMPLKSTYTCGSRQIEHEVGRYACPLLYPEPTGQVCPIAHHRWPKGGCVVAMPTCNGARIRYQLDRSSDDYKAVYNQRTADERLNSQAVALGIERPKLRRDTAIANQNTLIYALINLRTLHRIRQRKVELAQSQATVSIPLAQAGLAIQEATPLGR